MLGASGPEAAAGEDEVVAGVPEAVLDVPEAAVGEDEAVLLPLLLLFAAAEGPAPEAAAVFS